MKIKLQSKKLPVLLSGAIFAVAAIAGVVSVANLAMANQAAKITNFTATGNITINNKRQQTTPFWINSVDMTFNIPNISQYKAGDYIQINTENMNLEPLNGKDVAINGVNIAKVQRVSLIDGNASTRGGDINNATFQNLTPEASGQRGVYNIVFNSEIDNITDQTTPVKISASNISNNSAFASVDYQLNTTIKSDDRIIAINNLTIVKKEEAVGDRVHVYNGYLYSTLNSNGEFSEVLMNTWIHSFENVIRQMAVGDIVETRITDENSGVIFNNTEMIGKTIKVSNQTSPTGKNNHEVLFYNTLDYAEFEVIEASPQVMRYRVVKAPANKAFSAPILFQKFKVLDTSSNTIDLTNNKIKPVAFENKYITVDGQTSFQRSVSIGSDITGAKLSSQAQLQKRGSIIRQIMDENGDKIAGFENDILAFERIPVGEKYTIDTPAIEGYEFVKIDTNSVPLSGQIQEGVKTARLIYRKKLPAPTPAPELPQITQPRQEVQTPNTGFATTQSFLLPIFGTLAAGTYMFIRKK